MLFEEVIKKEGLESLQSKLQEVISSKVTDDNVVFIIEYDGVDGAELVSSFPADDDKYITAHIDLDEELDDENYIESIMSYIADVYWDCYLNFADELDLHQINCIKKLNNQ